MHPAPDAAYLPFDPAPSPLLRPLPAGACDCHFHIFEGDPPYPYATPRSYTPTPATEGDFLRLRQQLGTQRAVLVHPSPYGRDHRSFEALLARHGAWMRGVAVVYPDTPESDLVRWHALGARGTRINALFAGGASLDDMAQLVARVRPFGWHLQLLVDVSAQPGLVERAVALGIPVVVDHMGHFDARRGTGDPGFRNLCALLREGRVWVKLSGAYRLTEARSGYDRVAPIAAALIEANPDRLVWGSDWPHPAITGPMVDDGGLANLLLRWLDDDGLRRVLVDNPTRLYWSD